MLVFVVYIIISDVGRQTDEPAVPLFLPKPPWFLISAARPETGRNFGIPNGHQKKRANHSPEVVREGVGILLAPFLRDLLTYDLEAMKDALGIFATRARESAGSRR